MASDKINISLDVDSKSVGNANAELEHTKDLIDDISQARSISPIDSSETKEELGKAKSAIEKQITLINSMLKDAAQEYNKQLSEYISTPGYTKHFSSPLVYGEFTSNNIEEYLYDLGYSMDVIQDKISSLRDRFSALGISMSSTAEDDIGELQDYISSFDTKSAIAKIDELELALSELEGKANDIDTSQLFSMQEKTEELREEIESSRASLKSEIAEAEDDYAKSLSTSFDISLDTSLDDVEEGLSSITDSVDTLNDIIDKNDALSELNIVEDSLDAVYEGIQDINKSDLSNVEADITSLNNILEDVAETVEDVNATELSVSNKDATKSFADKINASIAAQKAQEEAALKAQEEKVDANASVKKLLDVAEANENASFAKRVNASIEAKKSSDELRQKIEDASSQTVFMSAEIAAKDAQEAYNKAKDAVDKYQDALKSARMLEGTDKGKGAAKAALDAEKEAQKAVYDYIAARKVQVREDEKAAQATAKASKEASDAAEKAAKEVEEASQEASKAVQNRLDAILGSFSNASGEVRSAAGGIRSAFSQAFSTAMGVLAAAGVEDALGGIKDIFTNSLEYASSVVETENLIAAVYETSVDDIIEWANETAKYYGLTSRAAENYVSITSAMLTNMGIASDKTIKQLSMNYTQLIGDIASAFNTTAEEVYESLRSGLSGHVVALQKYGLVLTEVNMNQYLMSKGIKTSISEMDSQSKQLARFAFIMEHTGDIQGDFSRTSDSFANRTRMLRNAWEEFLVVFGQYAIPLLKPVVHLLSIAVSYATALVEALAKVFGLERDTSTVFKNMNNAADYLLADTLDTTEAQEEGTEAQEATADAVKETNKALKAGIKLLDLYTLDFSDNASSASTKAGKEDELANITDLLNISDLKYASPAIDLGIEVDQDLVDKIAKDIKGIVDWLSSQFFVQIPLRLVQDWAENPIEHTIDLLIAGISLKSAFNLGKNVITYLINGMNEEQKAKFNKIIGIAKGIALGIIGVLESVVGGYNLGQVIYQSLAGKSINTIDALTGITTAISGIVTTASAGFAIGGPVGAAIGALLGLIGSAVGGIIGYNVEQVKSLNTVITEYVNAGESFTTVTEKFNSLIDSDSYKTALDPVINQLNIVKDDAEILVSDKLPSLYNSLSGGEYDVSTFEEIEATFDNLETSVLTSTKALNEVNLDAVSSVLSGLSTYLGTTTTEINNVVSGIETLFNTLDQKNYDLYESYKKIELSGGILTEQQKSYIESFEAMYLSATDNASKYIEDIKSTAEQGYDLTTYATAIDEFNDKLVTGRELFLTEIARTNELISIELSKPIEEQDETLLEQLNATIVVLENGLQSFNTTASTSAAKLASTMKGSFVDTFVVGFSDAINEGLIKYNNTLSDKELSTITKIGDSLLANKNFYVPISFEAVPKTFISQIPDADIETEEGRKKVSTYWYTLIRKSLDLDNAIEYSQDGTLKFNIETIDSFFTGNQTDAVNNIAKSALGAAGFDVKMSSDGKIYTNLPVTMDIEPYVNTYKGELTLKDSISILKKSESVSDEAEGAGNSIAEDIESGITEELASEKAKQAVQDSTSDMLEGVSTAEEAKKKGNEVATALVDALTATLRSATESGSPFMSSVDKILGVLNSIGTSLDSSIKSAISNIATYINTMYKNIQGGINSLGFTDDMTITSLLNTINTKSLNIPMLANGAVIPANNPFLAVLGDQRSGTNIEAPVSLIERTVREASGEQDVTVNATIYIGNEQIKDFVIDTVVDNNLSIG